MKFGELTQLAMLGTERQSVPMAAGDSPLHRLLAQVDANRREEALLAAAALCGLHEEIGQIPPRELAPLPEPCPAEQSPTMSERAGSLLLRLLAGDFRDVMPEFLALCAQSGQLPFPEALPGILDVGTKTPAWREAILPILGQRGRWLAAQNPEWAGAIGATEEDENIWHTGVGAARSLFLNRLRRENPARARELLAATWKEETPDDRLAFIAALEAGLTLEDEPFLEAALDDKRKEVRRAAQFLLGKLPDSKFAQRMTERTKPLLKFTAAKPANLPMLKKAAPASLEITLPAACDPAMQRDGVNPKPLPGFGEKIGWLIQMLEFAPLAQWTADWKTTPEEILKVSIQGEWKNEFFDAWTRAASQQGDSAWAAALLPIAVAANRTDKLEGLLAALSADGRERQLSALLSVVDAKAIELHGTLILHCRHAWSPEFSLAILAWLRRVAATQSTTWQLRNQLSQFARRLAPQALAAAATGWPVAETPEWGFWSKGVDEFLALAQFRADLHAAFPNPSSPPNSTP